MSAPVGLIRLEPVPNPPHGWFEHRYAVLADGALALVRCNGAIKASPSWGELKLRLSSLSYGAESGVLEVPGPTWPLVDRRADGCWLILSARARPGELNGHAFDADGSPAGRYAFDDAIEHLACTTGGTTWVAYFDERDNGSALIAFDMHGKRTWALVTETYALDCYALSTTGDQAWACTYPDFPIVRVEGMKATLWENEVVGARAIAAKGKHVILAGGYGAEKDRVALLSLGKTRALTIAEFHWPALLRATFIGGRDGVLHAVADGQWMQISISDWLAG